MLYFRLFVLTAAAVCVRGTDLATDLYRRASESRRMTEANLDGLDALIGPERSAGAVVVMFHEHSCGICQSALPELDRVAEALQEQDLTVTIAHIECSSSKEAAKRRANLRGYPALLVWRARAETVSQSDKDALTGTSLTVVADEASLLRAARLAGMGEDRDAQRLKFLGKVGQVLSIDLLDSTAQLSFGGIGKVWYPVEVLRREDGSRLPFKRAEAGFQFHGAWTKDNMLPFIENMLAPLVTSLDSSAWTSAVLQRERYPSLIVCGSEVTQGFEEAAVAWQGKARAFHAEVPGACPIQPEDPSLATVVILSPPDQQHSNIAAAAVAGPSIVKDDGQLTEWIRTRRFPGITKLTFHNFAEFVNAGRQALIVAVPPHDARARAIAARKLQEVAGSTPVGPHVSVYVYEADSLLLGVVDGSLDGLSAFGVDPRVLPRVIVFRGGEEWVEDVVELTLAGLPGDLQKLPQLWSFSAGMQGSCKRILRDLLHAYKHWNGIVIEVLGGGPWTRLVLPTFATFMCILNIGLFISVLRTIVRSVLESDPDSSHDESAKKRD